MRVAALDLGTNTFLLLVAEVEEGRITRVLHDGVRIVRLGQDVNRTKRFHTEALARAEDCLADYAKTLKALGAEKVLACATSAARDVENGAELIKIGSKYGIPIEVISGEREADLTFRGTVFGEIHDPIYIIDVGGGSTEFILGDESGIIARTSLDIGSVRLTEKFVTRHPIPTDELDQMSSYVHQQLEKLREKGLAGARSPLPVIAVAGTPTTLATLDQALPFESERVHGYQLSTQRIRHWIDRLAAMTVEERQKLAGMEPKRADVIVTGALILALSAEMLRTETLEVSVRGLRYGIARYLGGS